MAEAARLVEEAFAHIGDGDAVEGEEALDGEDGIAPCHGGLAHEDDVDGGRFCWRRMGRRVKFFRGFRALHW